MSTRSSKVSSPEVAELIQELIGRWPNHRKKDAAQLTLYVEDIGAMVEEFGLNRMRAAVAKARSGRCNFLPEAGELFKLLPAPEIYNGQPLHDPNCPDCSGSGWRTVEMPADRKRLALYPEKKTMTVVEPCRHKPQVEAPVVRERMVSK